jgi:polysaccharide biosynthesis/export protein
MKVHMKTSTLASLIVLTALAPPSALAQTAGTQPPSLSVRPAAGSGNVKTSEYRLVVGDKLRIEVYKDTQLSQALQIRPDGKITLPLVGDIVAAGQTAVALRDSIAGSLKEFITNPVVTVIVVEAQPQTISVIGEVNTPGVHPIKAETTVLEALAMAGGFKDFANTKNIVIQRQGANGVSTFKFNYKDAIKASGQPMYVKPGDVIIVP